jgi:hypothetical protein
MNQPPAAHLNILWNNRLTNLASTDNWYENCVTSYRSRHHVTDDRKLTIVTFWWPLWPSLVLVTWGCLQLMKRNTFYAIKQPQSWSIVSSEFRSKLALSRLCDLIMWSHYVISLCDLITWCCLSMLSVCLVIHSQMKRWGVVSWAVANKMFMRIQQINPVSMQVWFDVAYSLHCEL